MSAPNVTVKSIPQQDVIGIGSIGNLSAADLEPLRASQTSASTVGSIELDAVSGKATLL
jgi:hypothetical protein